MYDQYRTRVAGTTIDESTLLSTDYFNNFNEVIMLLGMLPEMPEMIEDIDAWRFRTYEEHFGDSGLPFAALAIEAYAHVRPAVRERFEQTIAQMRDIVDEARGILGPLADNAELDRFKLSALAYSMRLQGLVDTGSAIVHGGADQISDQSAIDALF
jgi:hypothetical protein